MPISKSAKKALRTAQAKRQRNITLKTKLKKTIKKASATNINEVVSVIDKAVKRNLLHKNKAARLKSKLAKTVFAEKTPVTKIKKTVSKKTKSQK